MCSCAIWSLRCYLSSAYSKCYISLQYRFWYFRLHTYQTGIESAAAERVLDYLREVIEEGLNVDVAGDPLLERLSVQLPPGRLLPGVGQLVQALGLTRITIHGVEAEEARKRSTIIAASGATGSAGTAGLLSLEAGGEGRQSCDAMLVAPASDVAAQHLIKQC